MRRFPAGNHNSTLTVTLSGGEQGTSAACGRCFEMGIKKFCIPLCVWGGGWVDGVRGGGSSDGQGGRSD